MAAHDQELLEARQEALRVALKSQKVENVMNLMADDVVFSDMAFDKVNLERDDIAEHAKTDYFEAMDVTNAVTKAVTGTRDFVAWEWTIEYVANKQDHPLFGIQSGAKAVQKGVSLMWWRHEGGDGGYQGWKISEVRAYYTIA